MRQARRKKSLVPIEPALIASEQILPLRKDPAKNGTARRAMEILVGKKQGFVLPTAAQKKNLIIAFVKKDMIVYGRGFDMVKLAAPVDLNKLSDIESNLSAIQLIEVKSTNKSKVKESFQGYFFGLTAAEVLVAQNLKRQFRFVMVNTLTKHHMELDIKELFGKARGIYPTWSILF
jgi:hypothetical protein